ncbi:MAG: hypothetical protein JNL07_11840 [Rhodospirillales bacterium]|nr:hypothetical protein [Rhodospirillales bacterium]
MRPAQVPSGRPLLVGVAIALVAVALALAAFCWWGLFTAAGQRAYDEMAGMIPYFAGIGAVVALLIAAALLAIRWWLLRR